MADLVPEIEKRKSGRALSNKNVPLEIIERIMTAAALAPSCFNNQPWRFLVVHDEPVLNNVKAALTPGNYWAKQAPVLIAVCTKTDLDCTPPDGRQYAFFDTGLAVENCLLQVVKEGLIAHAIAGFNQAEVKKVLSVPEEFTVITLIITGYQGDPSLLNENHRQAEDSARERLPLDKVVMYNRWKK
ncbi:MAG: nitroreductase family protein [Spirochaetales bacterium]|nr:nitroreductase family protein [Spirochaetales bacterium]